MNTLKHLMSGMPQLPPGGPWGAAQSGQGLGLPMMPGAPHGAPGRLPGGAGPRGRALQPPGPMPGRGQVHELQQHQGIPPELQERFQGMDPGYARLVLKAAQRLGRMPKGLLEVVEVLGGDQ